MNPNEVICLGVDGHIYSIKRFADLIYNDKGLPEHYEIPSLPSVELIAKAFSVREIEEHPLRKARFKMIAAKEHNITEKMRPQDVTIDEARGMAETVLRELGLEKNNVDFILKEYWS